MTLLEQAVEELREDLNLHRAILASLDSQRPDAIEQRHETLEAIKELESKLIQLRGVDGSEFASYSPFADHSITPPTLSEAQVDGANFSKPSSPLSPPQFGRPAFSSLPSRRRPSPPNRFSNMAPTRKRRLSDDGENSLGRAIPKRAALGEVSPTSTASTSSTPVSDPSSPSEVSTADDNEEFLMEMLGLEGRDTFRALQEEQKQAEKWLEEKKEQERRDAEFARSLMESFQDPQPSSSAQGSASSSHPASVSPERTLPSVNSFINAPPSATNAFSTDTREPPTRFTTSSVNPFSGSQFDVARVDSDSDDSDVAEITPRDFQRYTTMGSPYSRNAYDLTSYPSSNLDLRSRLQGLDDPSLSGPRSLHGAIPGPSDITRLEPNAWSNPLKAGMVTIKAMRDRYMLGGEGSDYFQPHISGGGPVGRALNGLLEHFSGQPLSARDIENLYEYGTDSKQLNEEIKQLLETIRPDIEIPVENREGTPDALKCTLLEHQKLGLAWMKSKEECDQKGGILADDMGLGKTIQAISLMVSRPSSDSERKTTLIIAPVALMQQWKREIQKMIKPGKHQVSIHVLHGDKRSMSFRDLKHHDVVLTTFGTLSSELKRVEKYEELVKSGAEEPTLRKQYMKSLPCLGPTSKWYRVIIDEAQCIKNRNTKAALACCRLNTIYRWCMSGTPMMNNVEELHSLLKFLRIRPYGSLEPFNRDFTRPLKSGNQQLQEKAMTQLRVLLKAVLLRRTKDSKIDGKPILNIPPRVSEKVHATFSEDELELYKSLENKTKLQFNKYLKAGTVGRNYSNILVLLLRLRQACCHPHLISDFSVKINENTEGLDFIANAKAFGEEIIIRLRDNDDLECPICIDAVENPVIFFPCGHGTCAECFSTLSDPALSLRQGIDGAMEVKCPNCRAMVDPKKITDHASFRKVHFPDPSDDSPGSGGQGSSVEEDNDDVDSDDSDSDSLADFLASDSDAERACRKSKGKGKLAKEPKKKTLAELKKEASKNLASKRKYMRRLEKTWITSAKIEAAMEIIHQIQQGDSTEKVIIFSQFTSLLDLLEVPVSREGHRYRRYDGSMRPADRNSAVLEFTDDPNCKIMLVSLKAGNAGLNLVAANHVIIFDPFWNPYIEEQAIDRAHRIGQMREVHVHRILVPQTVEDRIVELQDKKRQLIDGALDEKESKNIARLSTRELAYLFGIQT
ncbi:SNF2 family N-terminal domain-containing protein [Aspergillus pseudoustus]|uniref:SNF2 family N-terminal domain-containing protein n=1 Tax=Aspergillus pseudoustus TaxID=1810923 RepID=A0ABR4JZZ3_9EURO